jgi:hypothetical protein
VNTLRCPGRSRKVTKEELITILTKVLKTDIDLGFLSRLTVKELETLVACVRNSVEYPSKT